MKRRSLAAALVMSGLLVGPVVYGEGAATQAVAKADKATPTRVAVLKLTGTLAERPASFNFSLFGGVADPKAPSLAGLNATLAKAIKDPNIGGLLLDMKGFELSLSQAQELGDQIKAARRAHKRVVAFSRGYTPATYILASYCDTVVMPENGELQIPGVRLELMFWKGLFDKLNLHADMIQIGQFKGAREPFTETQATPEFKGEVDRLVDALYGQMVQTIADNRQITVKEATDAIDEGLITGKRATDKGLNLVDKLMTRDDLDDYLDKQFQGGADLIADYGDPKKQKIDMSNPFALFQILGTPKVSNHTSQPAIGVVYADGMITDDQPGKDDNTQNVTPARIRASLDKALNDDQVKAIVLRVDSPGGSAAASEEIWQMLKEADKEKPVTVSMGREAASGGYYIACAGRSITADPATITGSIGVVGGKVVIGGLLDKLGLTTEGFSRGKHSDIYSETSSFTPEEREFIKAQMTDTYKLFTTRVTDARGAKVPKIEEVALGRIFDGTSAIKAGLVDRNGSLSDTILAAAKDAHIEKSYQVFSYPEAKTFADVLRDSFGADAKMPIEMVTAIKLLPPAYRVQVENLFEMTRSLNQEHLLMAMPVGLIER